MASFKEMITREMQSSMWSEDCDTRCVWMCLRAFADGQLRVHLTPERLAAFANIPLAKCEAILHKFTHPDVKIACEGFDGCRLEVVSGGWVLNPASLPEVSNRRAYMRALMQSKRSETISIDPPQHKDNGSSIAEIPTLAETRAYATSPVCGFRPDRIEEWFYQQAARNWEHIRNWQFRLLCDRNKTYWQKSAQEAGGGSGWKTKPRGKAFAP